MPYKNKNTRRAYARRHYEENKADYLERSRKQNMSGLKNRKSKVAIESHELIMTRIVRQLRECADMRFKISRASRALAEMAKA